MHVLVTGGAGFIGSFIVDALIADGHTVRIFDNLEEQVHQGKMPEYLNKSAEFIRGDVRNIDELTPALDGIEVVIHCASAVGVGQSQYEIKKYTDVNVGGTANLLQLLIRPESTVKKVLVPTSMTCYGEGLYHCTQHGDVRPGIRPVEQLQKQDWQLHCPVCDAVVEPKAITEDAKHESATIYSLTKKMQEDMILAICGTYNISATAFRLFNVYGPRQSLSNPYTGVSAIFMSRLKNGNQPVVYEDGTQSRDFISVHDVVNAFMSALKTENANGKVMNIGSGRMTSIADIARMLAKILGVDMEPKISGEFRKNDVRHCFADNSLAQSLLQWSPKVSLEDGLRELVEWSKNEEAEDHFEEAEKLLKERNLQS